MSRNLKYEAMILGFWVTLLGLNAWDLGYGVAQGNVKVIVFSAILCAICLIASTFKGYDLYVDWQDMRYERAYLKSLEDPEVDEIVIVSANDPFTKAE